MDLLDGVSLLSVARNGDECVLGRPDLGIFVEVPEPGVVFVEVLQAGGSVADATTRASEAAGEAVDGEDFLATLAEAGLLAGADGAAAPSAPDAGRRIRWLEGVSQDTARRLFGPVAWTGYALAALGGIGVLLARPDLRPSYEDVWFLGDPVRSVLAYAPIGLAIAACHEAWHWLAGRAVGVPASFRVSYRGVFPVFETDLSQIVLVPRRRRYGPFVAGTAFDGCVLAAALVLRLLYWEGLIGLPPTLDRLLGAVVFTQSVSMLWQAGAVFLRTDGYAVLANALRCNDLYRITWLTMKDRLARLTRAEAREFADANPRDRSVARWFGICYLIGTVAMAWMLVNLSLPALIAIGMWLVANLAALSVWSVAFWESILVTAYLGTVSALPAVLAVRERRLRRAGALR